MNKKLVFPRVEKYFGDHLSLNNFKKISTLGQGSFGEVNLYTHIQSGKEYAIKKIQLNKEVKISRE